MSALPTPARFYRDLEVCKNSVAAEQIRINPSVGERYPRCERPGCGEPGCWQLTGTRRARLCTRDASRRLRRAGAVAR